MATFFKAIGAFFMALWSLITSFFPMSDMRIVAEPTVFDCGNEYYSVVWATSLKGTGYIEYSFEGETKRIYDAVSGIISTDDTVHQVLVPKRELSENSYKVGSQYVAFKYGYSAAKGKSVESATYNFKGVPSAEKVNILAISDIHGMENLMYKSLSHFNDAPDLLVLLGDIVDALETKSTFIKYILKDAADLSHSEIPVIFTRGNHETRGEFGAQMLRYFPYHTNEFYYTFSFGPLSAIVLDSGEDKEDSHKEYDGLVDFASYREKQYNWLCSLDESVYGDAEYKLAFSHDPTLTDHFGKDWTAPLISLGTDLIVGGHYHKSEFTDGALPVFIDCGKDDPTTFAASMITLENGSIRMLTIDNNGNVLLDKTISH